MIAFSSAPEQLLSMSSPPSPPEVLIISDASSLVSSSHSFPSSVQVTASRRLALASPHQVEAVASCLPGGMQCVWIACRLVPCAADSMPASKRSCWLCLAHQAHHIESAASRSAWGRQLHGMHPVQHLPQLMAAHLKAQPCNRSLALLSAFL